MTAQTKTLMVLWGCIFLAWFSSTAMAQVPHRINYQGFLTDASGITALDGAYDITFSIYTGAGGLLWQETQVNVAVDAGVFNVQLGQDPSGNPFPAFDGEMYLGVRVASDPEMIPRQLLTTVPFAFTAGDAETLEGQAATDFSASDHGHGFSDLTGTAADSQIPDTITIAHAGHTDTADHAVQADKADWAATADNAKNANQATEAGYADDAGHALTADSALTADNSENADMVDGLHAGAFSPAGHSHHFLDASDGSPAQALYVDGSGNVGIGTTSPLRALDISGKARLTGNDVTVEMNRFEASGYPFLFTRQYGVNAQVTAGATYNYGVLGSAENGSLGNYGVYGTTNADNGVGTFGIAGNSDDHLTYGGKFLSYSQRGIGVQGQATYSGSATTATSYGGWFHAASSRGTGVYALVDYSGSGLKYAGYFECDSDTGYGVYATVNGSYTNWAFRGVGTGSGSNGGWFSTEGEDTTAVYGVASSSSGTYNYNYGGKFYAYGDHGRGVYAYANGQYGIGLYAAGGAGGLAAHFRGNVKIARQSDGATVMELGEGLDYAEGFHVKKPELIVPGSVLIIDPETPGKLCMSQTPYDTKVAGIVAGANGLGSGVRLGAGRFDHDVALAGRVYCKVETTLNPIQAGDLLTTSAVPGHAMKAADREKAYGTILGKAMESMEQGKTGEIMVLVTLQ